MVRAPAHLFPILILPFLLCGVGLSQDSKPSIPPAKESTSSSKVIAEGVGTTIEEAKQDAFRNAVRQVVGVLVDSETLIEQDKIISDKIIAASSGYIKDVQVLETKVTEGKLVRITIAARVEKRGVAQKLSEEKVTSSSFDGESLFAHAITDLEAETNQAALVAKLMQDAPWDCLTVSTVGEPELISRDQASAKVKVTLLIKVDMDRYLKVSKQLCESLEKVALARGNFSLECGYDKRNLKPPFSPFADRVSETMLLQFICTTIPELFSRPYAPRTGKNPEFRAETSAVIIATNRNAKGDTVRLQYFLLNSATNKSFRQAMTVVPSADISLVDVDGKEVFRKSVSLEACEANIARRKGYVFDGTLVTGMFGFPDPFQFASVAEIEKDESLAVPITWIMPVFVVRCDSSVSVPSRFEYWPELKVPVELELSLDELKAIRTVKCQLSQSDNRE